MYNTHARQVQDQLKQLIRDLCAIPAPSHHEERRAEFCKAWFEAHGGQGVYIDEALNVVCPWNVTEDGPVVVIMAHTDTVFPDLEPLPFREDQNYFYCPGVCDDTAQLAQLMVCADWFMNHCPRPQVGVLFVANSCEEGLGNLKGSRQIVRDYGSRMRELISIDSAEFVAVCNEAVGSHRYRVTVRTEGGHSFGAFGNRNAIAVLSGLIQALYSVKVPQEGGSKTTYNVGTISGGTSVNTIAQEASMLYEYRSDSRACLAKMETMFRAMVDAWNSTGVEVTAELLGERPCTGDVDPARQQALVDRAAASMARTRGLEPRTHSGSTDCNIPLSVGIPAIAIGGCRGIGIHTREEKLDLSTLLPGMEYLLDFLHHTFYDAVL